MKNKGITLIALIITVIILLILASVTITTLTGNNGIITKTMESKQKIEQAEIEEQLSLAVSSAKLKKQGNSITIEDILEELEKQGVDFEKEDDQTLIIGGNHIYKIEEKDGKITWENIATILPNVAFILLSEESGKVVTGNSKVVKITGKNYGTLSCSSSNENIATASITGNTLTITGTNTIEGTETATITITGSNGGKALYTVDSHKHLGNETSGGGCYSNHISTPTVCGGVLVENTSSSSVCGGDLIITSTDFNYTSMGCPDGCTIYAGPYTTQCKKCEATQSLGGGYHAFGPHTPSIYAPSVGSVYGSCSVPIPTWICSDCGAKSTSDGICSALIGENKWSTNCGF